MYCAKCFKYTFSLSLLSYLNLYLFSFSKGVSFTSIANL